MKKKKEILSKQKRNGIKRYVRRIKTWQISKLNPKQKKDIKEMIHHFLRHNNSWKNVNYLTDEIMDIIRFGLS